MGVQSPKENQAFEIAISVSTLSREQTVQQFYLSEVFLPQVVLFHQNLVLAWVTQCHHNIACKESCRISAKPPCLLCPQLQKQQLSVPWGKLDMTSMRK